MVNFSFPSVFRLTGFDLKNNRRQIIGWSIAIFGLMFLYMILFPSIKGMAGMKMEAMPKEIMQFMGLENFSDMSNFITYFGMIYSLILIAISIFGATFAAKLVCGEEKTKTIEFLYSLKVSRAEIYVSKLITTFLAVLSVVICAIVATGICGFINGGETFVPADFVKIVVVSSFTGFFFAFLALALSGISSKATGAIGSMVVLLCYLLGYLSELLGDKAVWLAKLSPFKVFGPDKALAMGSETLVMVGVYVGITLLLVIAGGIVYRRRDFSI